MRFTRKPITARPEPYKAFEKLQESAEWATFGLLAAERGHLLERITDDNGDLLHTCICGEYTARTRHGHQGWYSNETFLITRAWPTHVMKSLAP